MKNKIRSLIAVALFACLVSVSAVRAQTNNPAQIVAQATQLLSGLPLGSSVTIQGQSFTLTTNASGQISGVTTVGPAGSESVSALTTPGAVAQQVSTYVAANDTNDSYYYSTNDLTAGVGVDYLQNSGQTIADIQIAKYGLIKSLPSIALEAGLLQGNPNGVQSTAGGYAGIDYRKPIGSVAAHVGADVAYDAWSGNVGGIAHANVELRQGQHLGESAGIKYEYEANNTSKTASTTSKGNLSGLWLCVEITYSF
jgi:hypothetical protein